MISIDIAAAVGTLELRIRLPPSDGVTVVVGPNGAGKSTLLRCLLGDLKPTAGAIQLGDDVLFRAGSIDVAMEERRLGFLPQRYALFPHMTVAENVGFGVRDAATREARVGSLLSDLEIDHLADRKSADLSGGESQRVALARALAIKPRALLLDERMAALDATTRGAVRQFLGERLAALEIPTLIVSHDIADARQLADRVAVLEAGAITQTGTLAEIVANPATQFVTAFAES